MKLFLLQAQVITSLMAIVIEASSEGLARRYAFEHATKEKYEEPKMWLDPETTFCEEIRPSGRAMIHCAVIDGDVYR